MALRIGTGDRDIGGMSTGDTATGDPVIITTAGTAGKWRHPCEGGCRMSGIRWLTLLLLLLGLSGCFLTKVATVPMRVGGAVVSVVPVIGNPVHDAIDTAADAVDALPL